MTPRRLNITRGLPGSGKTTWAKEWLVELADCGITAARVNRDDIRQEVFGAPVLTPHQEDIVTRIQIARVEALLEADIEVIVDDTNLNPRTVKQWQKIARSKGAQFVHVDFPTPVDTCVEQIGQRVADGGRNVPQHVVQRMHNRYLKKGFPTIKPIPEVECAPYAPDISKPTAWIFDVDGTLTTGPKNRNPYDYSKVHQDEGRFATIALLRRLREVGDRIIVVSGRDDSCADATLLWFTQHGIAAHALHMRKAGDSRSDDIVKAEIFDAHIRNEFNVLGVFDDRDQVVRFWRSIGLTCMQVDYGNF